MSDRKRQGQARDQGPDEPESKVIEVGWGAFAALVIGLATVAAIVWFVVVRNDEPDASAGGAGAAGRPGAVQEAGAPAVQPSGAGAVPTAALEPGSWFTADGDPALGHPNAPVTLIAFSDYQCPNCRQFGEEVLPWLRQRWMADGLVRVVFRDFAIRGAESHLAAQAAHCAGEQGMYWTYHDSLFAAQSGENQGAFSAANLARLAESIGLDPHALTACLESGRHADRVAASTKDAYDQGYEGTPTYLVNGNQTQGAIEIDRWEELFLLFAQDLAGATADPGVVE